MWMGAIQRDMWIQETKLMTTLYKQLNLWPCLKETSSNASVVSYLDRLDDAMFSLLVKWKHLF